MRHEGTKRPSAEWSKSSETPIGQHLSVIDLKCLGKELAANQFTYSSLHRQASSGNS